MSDKQYSARMMGYEGPIPPLPESSYLERLRDEFAMAALGGCELTTEDNMGGAFWYQPREIAKRCYSIADAMLAERGKHD
jgi:hypothetical protein